MFNVIVWGGKSILSRNCWGGLNYHFCAKQTIIYIVVGEKMNKIVVSLTSYPKRINFVASVIRSVWNQNVPADEIILYLSIMEFPQRERELPLELSDMIGKNGFTVKWVEGNIRSHKKYFYVLQEKRDDIVITVDDDTLYSETLIEDLVCSYKRFPQAVSARSARIILKDQENIAEYKYWDICMDKYANKPRMDLCAIGYAGVLYPPACAKNRWFMINNIESLAKDQDDLWLKYNEIIDQIPVVYVKPVEKDILIEEAEKISLCELNINVGNNVGIAKLSEWIKTYYFEEWEKWDLNLMQKREYTRLKRKDSIEAFQKSLESLGNNPVYLYGAGKRAEDILKVLRECNLQDRIEAIIVSDKSGNPDTLDGKKVRCIEELDSAKLFGVIYGVGDVYKIEVKSILRRYHCICLEFNIY